MKHKRGLPVLLAAVLLLCTACGNATNSSSENITTDSSAVSSALQEGGMKKIGDTVKSYEVSGSVMEYIVTNVRVYDHYTDTGIPESEFAFGINENPFVMLDVKVKKIDGFERSAEDSLDDSMGGMRLTSRSIMEGDPEGAWLPEMCYFSGHSNDGHYSPYWLDIGAEKVFQLGWCLKGDLMSTDNLVLLIGADPSKAHYIDLSTES